MECDSLAEVSKAFSDTCFVVSNLMMLIARRIRVWIAMLATFWM